MASGYDLKNEDDVKQFLENLGIEYRFGCYSENKPEVCHLLGDYLEAVNKDYEKASKVYKSNCDDMSHGPSCHKFGNYQYMGRGVKRNVDSAYRYFEKGCELGFGKSCLSAGVMSVTKVPDSQIHINMAKGLEYLEKSCNSNNDSACYYLSGVYISGSKWLKKQNLVEEGQLVERDMAKAYKYALKACELGNAYACANVSQMFRKGEGVEANAEMSARYAALAKDINNQARKEQRGITFGA